MSQETQELLQYLDMERNHVLGILEGFSEEQLRRPVLPSGWSCLGMVKHLALADEHYWFRSIVGGEPLDFFPEGPNAEWQVEPGESAEDVFNLYRAEIERANAIIASTPLDMAPRQLDPHWGECQRNPYWGYIRRQNATGSIPICKYIENSDGCGIHDQHAAADHSAMTVSQSVIHDSHPNSV